MNEPLCRASECRFNKCFISIPSPASLCEVWRTSLSQPRRESQGVTESNFCNVLFGRSVLRRQKNSSNSSRRMAHGYAILLPPPTAGQSWLQPLPPSPPSSSPFPVSSPSPFPPPFSSLPPLLLPFPSPSLSPPPSPPSSSRCTPPLPCHSLRYHFSLSNPSFLSAVALIRDFDISVCFCHFFICWSATEYIPV